LVLAGGFWAMATGCGPKAEVEQARREARVLEVEVFSVKPEPFQQRLGLTGSVQAEDEVVLRSEVSGMIEQIDFSDGQKVTQGRSGSDIAQRGFSRPFGAQ